MICYQDEKMYGPPAGTMTAEQLDDEIRRLEAEIYGNRTDSIAGEIIVNRPMIYDVKSGTLVERAIVQDSGL